jgi:hypothetical protein
VESPTRCPYDNEGRSASAVASQPERGSSTQSPRHDRFAPRAGTGSTASTRSQSWISDHADRHRHTSARRRKRSCGGGCWDGSFWAKAVVWPLAVFANCWRSEAIVSKRSGISPDLRQRLRERAESANAQRFPLVQSGRSGSLAGADSQAAEIPQQRHCARLASAFGRKRARARCRDHAAKGAVHGRVMRGTRFQRSAGLSGGVIYGLALRWHHGCRDS